MLKLNCDLGEGFGHWHVADEAAIMPHIDLANVACGFHAGDPLTITHTLQQAQKHGVVIGAHPGYPDRLGFGRRTLAMGAQELRSTVVYQIGALEALAHAEGMQLEYVKPHGALYNDMMQHEDVFEAIAIAVSMCAHPRTLMILSTAANDQYAAIARRHGIELLYEFFADRAYTDAGMLVPRSEPNALIHDADRVLARIEHLVTHGSVTTVEGATLPLEADTICVHGDNPEALILAQTIRARLDALQ